MYDVITMGRTVANKTQALIGVAAAGLLLSAAATVYALGIPTAGTFSDVLVGTLILAVIAVVAEELRVPFSGPLTLAASNLPVLLAIMFLGLWPALLVAFVVGTWGFWREDSAAVVLFNLASAMCSAFVAWAVFAAVHGWAMLPGGDLSWSLLVSGALANVTFECLSLGVVAVGSWLRYGTPVRSFWRVEAAPFVYSLATLTALGLIVAAVYAEAGEGAVVLLLVPVFAAQYMFKLLVREKEHVAAQAAQNEQYLEMNIGLAAAMVVLLDSKDQYTAQHSAAVAMYCRDIAAALNLPRNERNSVHFAGLLHDLGKVGVPDAVLRKNTKLTPAEWALMRQHPSKGAEVLSNLVAYQDIADIVLYHHERLDGSGYPFGVTAERIPEMSKLLAVADTYHALTSARPYRSALSSFEALKEIRSKAGLTLDETYVEALAAILRDKSLGYRDGTSTDFTEEFEIGRINLRLRGDILADLSGLSQEERGVAGT